MKKLAALFFIAMLAIPAVSATTDPFFMLGQGKKYLDSELGYYSNYRGGDGAKYLQLKETLKYGAAYNWEIYASLGFANLKSGDYKESGFIDPEFGARYRVSDTINSNWILDLSAYLGPSLFDSPNDVNQNGVAKGTTDIGVKGILGKMGSPYDPWTLGATAGIDFVRSANDTKSAVDFHLGGVGKYYLDEVNSIDGEASINLYGKRVSGGDTDTSLKFAGGYSRDFLNNLELSGLLGFAAHSEEGAKGEIFLTARLRWHF